MARTRRERIVRILIEADDRMPPTPQTVAKLREDVIGGLIARGRLSPVHARTTEEIRTVCEAVGRGMFPTAQPMDWRAPSGTINAGRDFLDRMSEAERRIWQRRYLPWVRRMEGSVHRRLAGRSWLRLVLDIVVENAGLRTVERLYGLRNGAALGYLSEGLARYGETCD